MRKHPPHAYFLIVIALLSLLSMPKRTSELLRSSTIAVFAPAWEYMVSLKSVFNFKSSSEEDASDADLEELRRLSLENTLLRNEISQLQTVMRKEFHLLNQLTAIKDHPISKDSISFIKKRHHLELQKLLSMQLEAVPARVIFRSAASWSSSLWVNVGQSTNESLGRTVVAKNSPVIIDTAVVGVIDFVGQKQSRVRLITDSGLTPSVRALRGSPQMLLVHDKIQSLLFEMERVEDALPSALEYDNLRSLLMQARESLIPEDHAWYLAKGELHGASKPLWRSQGNILKGIGFNYDFSDSEGPARDLRSGKPLESASRLPAMPILKAKDLLITTGMDGVFPPGLLVAEVKALHLLKEGDYTYELDAVPVLGNLDSLSLVFIIPPIGFDSEEQPLPIGW